MFDLTEALSPFVARNGCAGQLQFGGENSTTFEGEMGCTAVLVWKYCPYRRYLSRKGKVGRDEAISH